VRRAEGENMNIGPIRLIGPIFYSEFLSDQPSVLLLPFRQEQTSDNIVEQGGTASTFIAFLLGQFSTGKKYYP
jgi:hypothetical protein